MAVVRGAVLITGLSRSGSIGYAIAKKMIELGRDVVAVGSFVYDARVDREPDDLFMDTLVTVSDTTSGSFRYFDIDLAQPNSVDQLFVELNKLSLTVTDLILSHCESVDSDILTTTVESFDRHYSVNVRASWLLVRDTVIYRNDEFGEIIITALTSDHTAFNLPYGSSKGALDRVVLAAADEFSNIGLRANVVNPGPVDTGWITDDSLRCRIVDSTPLGRVGVPGDVANVIAFLHSKDGGWINRQLIYSNGGFHNFN
ncbi:MAG: SDR family oxidoreductase [Actinomycetota bacterium]|nr:SDR family oxidoreductase [Actinomycetota bacterium]